VFANKVMRSEVNDTGETVDRNFSFLKAYSVFNAEQIDADSDEVGHAFQREAGH